MDDQAAKLLSGHAGACAVLVEVLIDKGIISQSEVYDRFQRARSAAGHWPGSRAAVRELADIVDYLKPDAEAAAVPPLDRTALIGETVLVVEADSAAGRELQTLLERAGAEALLVRSPAEALPRIAQFDFSVAVVEWQAATREHRTLLRWLREDGVPFVLRAARLPEDQTAASGQPVLLKDATPQETVAMLARLTSRLGADSSADAA